MKQLKKLALITALCATLALSISGCSNELPLITPMPEGYVTIAPVTQAPTAEPTPAMTDLPTATARPESTVPSELTSLEYDVLADANSNAKRTAANNVLKLTTTYADASIDEAWLMATEDGYMVKYSMGGGTYMYAVGDMRYMEAGTSYLQVIDILAQSGANANYLEPDKGLELAAWGKVGIAEFAESELGYSVSYTLVANALAATELAGVSEGDSLKAAFDLDEALLISSMKLTKVGANAAETQVLTIAYDYASELEIPEQVVNMLKSEETFPVTLRMNGIHGIADVTAYVAKNATLGINAPSNVAFYYDEGFAQQWRYSDGAITEALTLYAKEG